MAEISARIKPKKSSATTEVPSASDLEVAELAVNTADGKLFTKHTDNSIKTIGGNVSGIDDLTDVDTSTVAPTDGQALLWDNANSQWEPGDVIEEAPIDDAHYVRRNGVWVNEDEMLLFRYAINADGGDYDIGESRGAYVTLDPGDFDTGTSSGIDQTVDGGVFA